MAFTLVSHKHLIGMLRMVPWRARRAIFKRRYERHINETGEAELPLLKQFVGRGDLCLDIGANLGTYAYELGRLTGYCVAFEPNPQLADLLCSLHLEGVEVRQLAIADSSGTAEFSVPPSRFGHALGSLKRNSDGASGAGTYLVRTARVDDLGLETVRFIKIDVEGFEEEVIDGAIETIRRDKPTLLIEIEERQNAGGIERISRKLGTEGYEGYFYDRQWLPLSHFDPATHQSPAFDDPADVTGRRALRFFNNFLFVQGNISRNLL